MMQPAQAEMYELSSMCITERSVLLHQVNTSTNLFDINKDFSHETNHYLCNQEKYNKRVRSHLVLNNH